MSAASSRRLRRPRRARLVTVGVLLTLLAGLAVTAPPPALAAVSDTPTESWVTNGDVNAVTQAAGRVYLGGSFDQVGPNTGSAVALDPATGSWSSALPKVNGVVYVAVPDGAGGFYVGGDFTRVGDKSRQNGARILADGTVGNWNPNTDLPIRAIVLSQNAKTAWIGGDFTVLNKALNPIPAAGLAATNIFSGAAIWTLPSVTAGSVSTLALSADGSRLYAGGTFTSLAGVARARLAAVDAATGALDATFNPGADGAVNALAATADGRIVLGGDFTRVGGVGRSRLAALTGAGAVDTAWPVEADGRVDILAPTADGSRLFVGGDFTTIGGVPRRRLAALSTGRTVSVDPTWDPGAESEVRAIAVTLDGSRIYAGGGDDNDDPSLTGPPRRLLIAIDAAGTVDATFDPRPAAATEALALSSSLVFAGGQFTSVNGVARANLAALDATSGVLDSGFTADTDGPVMAVASDGVNLYAGGTFSAVNGTTRRRLVRVDAATGAVAPRWQVTASAEVDSLLLAGSQLYVGGTFSSLGGAARSKLGRVSADTGAVDDWNPGLDAAAQGIRLAPDQQSVYVAGDFSVIGTTPRQKLAAIDVATGLATAWYPKPKVPLTGVAISGDGSLAFVPTRGSKTAGNRIQAYSTVSGALVWGIYSGGSR